MPEGRHHHVLNGSELAVRQSYLHPLGSCAGAGMLVAFLTSTLARALAAVGTGLRSRAFAAAGIGPAVGAGFRFHRLPVPLGIQEIPVGLHVIVKRRQRRLLLHVEAFGALGFGSEGVGFGDNLFLLGYRWKWKPLVLESPHVDVRLSRALPQRLNASLE